jgi:hypothetical protein
VHKITDIRVTNHDHCACSLTFAQFMKAQEDREDPVGDLARDIARDRTSPKLAKTTRPVWNHLLDVRASHEALKAFGLAWEEYELLL